MRMSPALISSSPAIMRSSVDLPQPEGPTSTISSPSAISKEVRIETVFRYANIFDRALQLIASGKVDLKPLITDTFRFEDSIKAFDRAASARPTDIKLQILMDSGKD